MGKYVFFRVLNYVVLLFIAVNVAYFLAATQLNPRSLFQARNPPLDIDSVNGLLTAYNINDETPLMLRWWRWISGVFRWDWGYAPNGDSVNAEVATRIWVSLRLILIGTLLGTVLGVLGGVVAAVRQYKPADRVISTLAMLFSATPSFVLATILIALATLWNNKTGIRIFEFTGLSGEVGTEWGAPVWDALQHLMLPTAVLVCYGYAFYSRIQRNLMLDTLGADYVRTARAKGLSKSKAVFRHALRTALIPTGTYFAFSIAGLFLGATVTEQLFSFPGMGVYGVLTISGQDINGTVAVTAFAGMCTLIGAILSDITVAILDPRVRLS